MIVAVETKNSHDHQTDNHTDSVEQPHVLLVIDQLPRALGGGERIAMKLAALLPKYGYRASILSFSIDPQSAALQSPPCPIYLLPLSRTYDLAAFRAALNLRQFLRQSHIQIVQTFFESSDIWAGFIAKATSNAKLIWSRRDMGILRAPKHSLAYRLMAKLPDAVLTVSEQVRRHSIDVDGIDPDLVKTIYNGLNLSSWDNISRRAKTSGNFVVTTVGNIRRVKGHDLFIRAAAVIALKFPDVQFSIAGDILEPDYYLELQQLIRDLKLSRQFQFTGSVANLREHLTNSDIFVLPSRSEGFSNAIIEAMAASLPVVATDVGGNAEAVINEMNGFLVPSEDVAALSAAITRLLSDPETAKAMGAMGRALVEEKFTIQAMMQHTVDVYDKVLCPR